MQILTIVGLQVVAKATYCSSLLTSQAKMCALHARLVCISMIEGNACLLVHSEVRISARAAVDCTSLVVAGGLLYRSLTHCQGLWVSASGRCAAVSLGAGFMLRCAGAVWWVACQYGNNLFGFTAHAQRNACNGREHAEWEVLDTCVPVYL